MDKISFEKTKIGYILQQKLIFLWDYKDININVYHIYTAFQVNLWETVQKKGKKYEETAQ